MKITKEQALSVIESALFISSEPLSLSSLVHLFKNHLSKKQILSYMEELAQEYQKKDRGMCLQKIQQSYQLRTKPENKEWLVQLADQKTFRLSGPALEVLSSLAYKQPCTRQEIDSIRGVESSHLLRTLMEKGLVSFAGKSELPGKPSLYKTTDKFLETFGFTSLKDLPPEEEIQKMISAEEVTDMPSLSQTTDKFSSKGKLANAEDEIENEKLKQVIQEIPVTVDFLESSKKQEQKDS